MKKKEKTKKERVLDYLLVLLFAVVLFFMAGVPAYQMIRGMATLMADDGAVMMPQQPVAESSVVQ